jgi:hypothetical protein
LYTTMMNATRNQVQRQLLLSSSASSALSASSSASIGNTGRRQQQQLNKNGSMMRMSTSSVAKFGLGSQNRARMGEQAYEQLVATSLQHGVTLLEAGQEGGDAALAKAYRNIAEQHPQVNDLNVTMTMRVGYRTLLFADSYNKEEEQLPSSSSSDSTASATTAATSMMTTDDVLVEEREEKGKFSRVLHNISAEYIQQTLQQNPLVELQKDFPIDLRVLVHNPEAQLQALLENNTGGSGAPSLEERHDYIWSKLQSSLEGLEWAVSQKLIASHGIVSNGLGLPSKHPLHFPSSLILNQVKERCPTHFTTVQLPANLLERTGIHVARELHQKDPQLEIFAMRPLSCYYPDLGTGTGHPFGLVDFNLPGSEDPTKMQYTHEMQGPPAIYQVALQTAMSHFDADHLLEAKTERELTVEERETLDGCKLCQSMLHDLDKGLETVRSFAAHEDDLYQHIIPVIYDTFEDFDETTGEVLQAFFAAYAVAVRYAIAKRTRQLLLTGVDDDNNNNSNDDDGASSSGGSSSSGNSGGKIIYEDLPDKMKLQEYALRKIMAEPAFKRLVIGATTPTELLEDLDIVHMVAANEGGSPLHVIQKLKEEQDKAKEVAAREDVTAEEEEKEKPEKKE